MSNEKKRIELNFAGDKSISHRAAIFSALAKGESHITNYLGAEDTLNTLYAMEKSGALFEKIQNGSYKVTSPGIAALKINNSHMDMGNSGTGSRLLLGLFSGLPDAIVTIDGDASLRKRPMARVTTPLVSFGAQFEPLDKLPIKVNGAKLLPVIHSEEIGSAQVKSALILAALASQVPLRIEEKIPSRDHTENMLAYAGIQINKEENGNGGFIIEMEPPYILNPVTYNIWGDISSASFFVVLGLLMKDGELVLKNVLLNPYRDRYLHILIEMGGNIEIIPGKSECGEKGGDIIVRPSRLKGLTLKAEDIPSVIDELPVLTIAGLFAEGFFEFRNAKELRFKESDRITSMVNNLKACNVNIEEFSDGLRVEGNPDIILQGNIESFMDHRIAMSFEIANKVSIQNGASEKLSISGAEWIKTSFPDFYDKLNLVS